MQYKGQMGNWHIEYSPKPIPVRTFDYDFAHEDFDGAPLNTGESSFDKRCGNGESVLDCIEKIKEIENDG